MQYSIKTDKGAVRSINQDNCFITVFDENCCFAVVCDGMGGPNAGEIASEIAVKNISERFIAGWRNGISISSVKNLLVTAINAANICIYDSAQSDSALYGMGTTAAVAVILYDNLIVAHVGDSRVYLLNDKLNQLTKDHSLVQELVDKGKLSAEDAVNFPHRNVITRALGINEHLDIDIAEFNIYKGDTVLLCSDGLTNFVPDDDIVSTINNEEIESVAEKLVKIANKNGGGDNITAIVIHK